MDKQLAMNTMKMTTPTKDKRNMTISFTVKGEPFGKERPRVIRIKNRSLTYTPKKTSDYETLVRLSYQKENKDFSFPKNAPLSVTIKAYYKVPKSTSKEKQKQMLEGKIRPIKRPDLDNIGKVICDSLNKTAYHDDSSIVDVSIKKYYSFTPRVDVVIKEI